MVQQTSAAGLAPVGATVTFSKTVGESDIYLFAGITGDLSPNHVNAEYMKATRYGRIIAHGVLIVGYMSTCSTKIIEQVDRPAVSLGYDRVRFLKPVFVGDTVTVTYRVDHQDANAQRTVAEVTATNQHGEVVATATHVLKYL
jgi:3-hydroxybutyryl-CoA dehydratase